jgi:hypothetical protein
VNFDEALAAGQGRMMEYFSDAIGGLSVGHISELREIGFFDQVRARTGLNVDVGSWEEIPAARLDDVVAVIDSLIPRTAGLRNLLDDLKKMAVSAKHDGCSIAFLLREWQSSGWRSLA